MANRKIRWTFVLVCLAGSLDAAGAQPRDGRSGNAEALQRYALFNADVHRQLRAIDPAAEDLFQQADDARMRGEHRAAADLYKRVLDRVPKFVHAMRRQALEELNLGNRRPAISLLDRALALDSSPQNLSMLAVALIATGGEDSVTDADLARAENAAKRACAADPDDPETLAVCGQVALVRRDRDWLDAVLRRLTPLDPNSVTTEYLTAMSAWAHGDIDQALTFLERARAAGLSDEVYREVRDALAVARPAWTRYARFGGLTAAVWLGGALVLFGAGLMLSALAIRMSTRVPARADGRPGRVDRFTRRIYRAVLFASCAYYYLSLPLLLAVVVLGGGGILYGLISLGRVPIKLLIIVFIVMVVTAWAILRSLFVRGHTADPGIRIHPDEHRRLWQVLREVAERVGTRPVDAVYITPGTELAVFERGGLWRQLTGATERSLILGIGVLDNLQLKPLKAVLTHEYGHFSNRDTAGGSFALAVRRSLTSLAFALAHGGAAAWYNPVWLFVRGFHNLFLRISQGASRLQEVLADRWAATLYGGQAFEDGLRHVIDRSVRFGAHLNASVEDMLGRRQPLANLYQYTPTKSPSDADLEYRIRQALDADPSPYDSHPRPVDRFRWVHALGVDVAPAPDDRTPAWELFSDRTSVEVRMTQVVREAVTAAGSDPGLTPV